MGLSTEYTAVIFDYDGVLVAPTEEDLFIEANRKSFFDVGITPEREEAERIQGLLGKSNPKEEVTQAIRQNYSQIDPETYWELREKNASVAQKQMIQNGKKEDFEDTSAISTLSKPCAIVSNNQQWTIDFSVDFYSWGDRFSNWFGREPSLKGLQRQKPNDYYIQKAISALGTDDVLYVGDKESDILAGKNANIDTVLLSRNRDPVIEMEENPTYTIDSLEEL